MRNEVILNPNGSNPRFEFPHDLSTEANWTEFYFFFAYDSAAGVGINIHMGREPAAAHLWRAVVSVYLPDGDLLVLRSYGADSGPRGPCVGPLTITCVDPLRLWAVDFDGVAQPSSRSRIVREPHRDGPSERVKFRLLFEAAAPMWDPHKGAKTEKIFSTHFEQICAVRGQFQVRGRSVDFSGAGARDHSSGSRDYTALHGHYWVNGLFADGSAFMAQNAVMSDRAVKAVYIYRADAESIYEAKLIEGPAVADAESALGGMDADPVSGRTERFLIETDRGPETIEGEIIHCTAATLLPPSEEFLGSDRSIADALQFVDAVARFKWNGKVGYGVWEKSARMKVLRWGTQS